MAKHTGLIIGISGLAGSGKSTVAEMLADWKFVTIALADPIKRIARDVYAFSDEQLWGPSQLRNAPDKRYRRRDGSFLTPRRVCQKFGTEGGRDCYEDTWIDLCVRTAQQLLSDETGRTRYSREQGLGSADAEVARPSGVAIPDVRFLNEIHAIQAAGGLVVRIVRPGAGLDGSAGQHSSEIEQANIPGSKFNFVIDNSGTLEDLREMVISMLRQATPAEGKIAHLEQEVQRLTLELEIEQQRLAACGVAALGYFENCCDEYKSASLNDTLKLRAQTEQLRLENEVLRRRVRGG